MARIGRRGYPSGRIAVQSLNWSDQGLAGIEYSAGKEALAIQMVVVSQRCVLVIGSQFEHRPTCSPTE